MKDDTKKFFDALAGKGAVSTITEVPPGHWISNSRLVMGPLNPDEFKTIASLSGNGFLYKVEPPPYRFYIDEPGHA